MLHAWVLPTHCSALWWRPFLYFSINLCILHHQQLLNFAARYTIFSKSFQGLHRSWKSWKVREIWNLNFHAWKVRGKEQFLKRPGKSWIYIKWTFSSNVNVQIHHFVEKGLKYGIWLFLNVLELSVKVFESHGILSFCMCMNPAFRFILKYLGLTSILERNMCTISFIHRA